MGAVAGRDVSVAGLASARAADAGDAGELTNHHVAKRMTWTRTDATKTLTQNPSMRKKDTVR